MVAEIVSQLGVPLGEEGNKDELNERGIFYI